MAPIRKTGRRVTSDHRGNHRPSYHCVTVRVCTSNVGKQSGCPVDPRRRGIPELPASRGRARGTFLRSERRPPSQHNEANYRSPVSSHSPWLHQRIMNFLQFIGVLVCALFVIQSDAYQAIVPKVKIINGKCIHSMYNVKIPTGESFYPEGMCEEHRCLATKREIIISGCGKIMAPPNCEAVFDKTKRYPECCVAKFICKDNEPSKKQ